MAGHDFGGSDYLKTLEPINTIAANLGRDVAMSYIKDSLLCEHTHSMAAQLTSFVNQDLGRVR